MSLLWILIAVIFLLALVIMATPLVRQRSAAPVARKTYDVAIYKDQLKEAEREFERGLLTPEQVEAVKIELQRKLLASATSTGSDEADTAERTASQAATAIGILIFLGAGSLGAYLYLGSPAIENLAYADRDITREQQQAAGNQKAVAEMTTLVERLEKRMEQDPDNLEGWLMLGRSASSLGQFPRALRAYEQALQRAPENPQILVDYAETVVFLNEGRVSSEALQALEKAHLLNAAHPKARYYIALRQAQSGYLKNAVQEWIDLLAISLPDASWVPTVRAQIDAAANEAEIDLATMKPSEEALRIGTNIRASVNARPTAPGPTREDVEAASEMNSEDRQEMIRSMVERLAERLRDNPDDREGWLRLANAYRVLGQLDKASEAQARAEKVLN